jgi:hypothetical protein
LTSQIADDSTRTDAHTQIAREVVLIATLGNHIHHCEASKQAHELPRHINGVPDGVRTGLLRLIHV